MLLQIPVRGSVSAWKGIQDSKRSIFPVRRGSIHPRPSDFQILDQGHPKFHFNLPTCVSFLTCQLHKAFEPLLATVCLFPCHFETIRGRSNLVWSVICFRLTKMEWIFYLKKMFFFLFFIFCFVLILHPNGIHKRDKQLTITIINLS